jgi:hypothetical protein
VCPTPDLFRERLLFGVLPLTLPIDQTISLTMKTSPIQSFKRSLAKIPKRAVKCMLFIKPPEELK